MPKRKGLGKDIAKSLEIMGELHASLLSFENAPIKEGLKVNKALDDGNVNLVNQAKAAATNLVNLIEDLRNKLNSIRTDVNSRFNAKSASIVIQKFLERVN